MANSSSSAPTNVGFLTGSEWLDQEDATEIRKWLTTAEHAESCFAQVDFSTAPVFPDPSFVDEQVRLFDELSGAVLQGRSVNAKYSAWKGALAAVPSTFTGTPELVGAAELCRAYFTGLVYVGLVQGGHTSWVTPLSAALAVGASKKVLRSARIAGAGREGTYYAEAMSALREGQRAPGEGQHVADRALAARDHVTGAKNDIDVMKIPVEHKKFAGPTPELPYVGFKSDLQAACLFYGFSGRRAVIFIFRHLARSLRWEMVAALQTNEPTLDMVWEYLDQRYGTLETPQSAATRWEKVHQRADESVLDYYARVRAEADMFRKTAGAVITEELVGAKFLNGLKEVLRSGLDISYAHRLTFMKVEEVRDAAVYVEDRVAKSARNGPVRGGKDDKRAGTPAGTGPKAAGEARSLPGGDSGAAGCEYCLKNGYAKDAIKHSEKNCWKNPANADRVPKWYKDKFLKSSPQSAAPSTGTSKENPKSFAVSARSLKAFRARCWGSPSKAAGSGENCFTGHTLAVVVDTGADFTLMDLSVANALGLSMSAYDPPRPVTSAAQGGTLVVVVGEADVLLSVKGLDGKDSWLKIRVRVCRNMVKDICGSAILLGMETNFYWHSTGIGTRRVSANDWKGLQRLMLYAQRRR